MEIAKKSDGETLFDLTLFAADTPASPSQPRAKETEPTTLDTFGLGYDRPLANYDPNMQSWRMSEDTFLSDSLPFLAKWPPSGTTRSGNLFPRPQLVRLIGGRESSLSPTPSGNWPTPTVSDIYTGNLKSSQQKDGSMHSVTLPQAVKMWPTPTTANWMTSTSVESTREHMKNGEKYSSRIMQAVALEEATSTGHLNPMWVEWLMGFPLGWTDLEDLETQ
jgi:hypothetical protein